MKLSVVIFLWVLSFSIALAHEGTTVVVRMTPSGFEPEKVEILVGDTVVFENVDTRERWPASNIHPTHSVYPGSNIEKCFTEAEPGIFDACKGILTGEKHEFTFSKEGSWRFHDHLLPDEGGLIVVLRDEHAEEVVEESAAEVSTFVHIKTFLQGLFYRVAHWYYSARPGELTEKMMATDVFATAQDDSALRALLAVAGPDAVISDLVLESGGEVTLRDCHQQAHRIGRVAYELYGAEAFEQGTASCHSGYYHGAMEAFLSQKGTLDLSENIQNLCSIFKTQFGTFECLHGVGHGLMAYENYDLMAALHACDTLADTFSARSCYGGVFMENIVAAQGLGAIEGHATEWVSDDPHYPCSALPKNTDRYADCYLMQTSWMLSQNGYDYAKTAAECLKTLESVRSVCFQSLGRDIAGNTLRDAAQINQLCEHAPQQGGYFDKCIVGALNVIVDFWGPTLKNQAADFCATVKREGRQVCEATLAARLDDFQVKGN